MADEIRLRVAREDECRALSDLAFRSKAFWGYSRDFMEACRAELKVLAEDIANTDRHYVLAKSKGAILGYYAPERLSVDEYELEALFVEPDWIGQGIGRRLIEHAKAQAWQGGAHCLIIQGDPNAADFYRAAGGVQVGERESGSIPGRYLPVFRIELASSDSI